LRLRTAQLSTKASSTPRPAARRASIAYKSTRRLLAYDALRLYLRFHQAIAGETRGRALGVAVNLSSQPRARSSAGAQSLTDRSQRSSALTRSGDASTTRSTGRRRTSLERRRAF